MRDEYKIANNTIDLDSFVDDLFTEAKIVGLRKGLKRESDVAKAIGYSPSYFSQMKNGDRAVSIEAMLRICHFIGRPLTLSLSKK